MEALRQLLAKEKENLARQRGKGNMAPAAPNGPASIGLIEAIIDKMGAQEDEIARIRVEIARLRQGLQNQP